MERIGIDGTATQVLGVIDDPAFDLHKSPTYHPERPERLLSARTALARAAPSARRVPTRPAKAGELARVHDPAYIEELEHLAGREAQLDPDTYLSPGSTTAALLAAGGGVNLIDALIDGDVTRGVALVRPPGHHARRDAAMGFCLVNNVAVAAAHAHSRGVGRVLIVDWDVHHGNGTQEMFYSDPRVLYASLHQWPFYPGTGSVGEAGDAEGRGYTINVPLGPGADAQVYKAAFERLILPAAESYQPELVLVSAGFDAHREDPLASMILDDAAFAWMTSALVSLADKHAKSKIALFLEGGYNLSALETSLEATLRALAGTTLAPLANAALSSRHEAEIERARRAAREFWPV